MAKKESKDLVKTEPSKLLSPFEELEKRFEDMLKRPFSLMGPAWFPRLKMPEMEGLHPSVDIFEEGKEIVIKAELPGLKKEEIDVKLTDNSITISGEKKKEDKVEKKDYYRFESSYGSFTRVLNLPSEVQTDKAKAQFKNGVLEIRVPKTDEAVKKEKKVTIE